MNEKAVRKMKDINSNTNLLTESICTSQLQKLVSETAILLFNYIREKESSPHFIYTGLYSSLKENDFIGNRQITDENKLKNHLRLVALFLILHQFATDKIITDLPDSNLAQNQIEKAYLQLPQNFRNTLEQFKEAFSKIYSQLNKDSFENIASFPADIIGSVYNKFSFNEHQHNHGQHFTQSSEADILIAFCINENTKTILDSSCGSGTFLLRAFQFLQHFNPGKSKDELLQQLTGVDISPYATYLSAINLFLKTKNNFFPQKAILNENFLNLAVGIDTDKRNHFQLFDACIGNPPFIRHEEMEDKKSWLTLIKEKYGISYISGQSDLYIYFLIHTSFFLKEGARLGYVISASWLDVQFGGGVQKFLLDHFKIIAVIDYQAKRSFETASVNTVLLVIEKCNAEIERGQNLIKFVRIKCPYKNLIGETESKNRIEKAIKLARRIEGFMENFADKKIEVEGVQQFELEKSSAISGKYSNGHWGARYLRSPEIYKKIIDHAGDKFLLLSKIAEVKYGIKTGANDFFYLIDETHKAKDLSTEQYQKIFGHKKEKHQSTWDTCGWFFSTLNNQHFIIEKEYVVPVFKTQKEADKLEVNKNKLKFVLLNCPLPKEYLMSQQKSILGYIHIGEMQFNIHKRPSVSGRKIWYDLSGSLYKGEFIFPSKIGEKYRLIDNRKAQVVCDKVNYVIKIKKDFRQYEKEIFLILNSIYFRYFIDLFSRQLTGSQTLSDVDVNLLKKTSIPHPAYFRDHCDSVETVMKALKSREQLPLSKEVLQQDKFKIDLAIFKSIGLKENDVNELYREAALYVEKRQIKSESLKL